MRSKRVEDLGSEDVPAHDGEPRWRFAQRRLLDKPRQLVRAALDTVTRDDAVAADVLVGDRVDRDDSRAVALEHVEQLPRDRRPRVEDVVGEQDGEGLASHYVLGGEHGMAEAELLLLAN